MDNFGTRLRHIRLERKLTQEQLAELCETTENVIRGYEKSRRMPKSDMVIKLCNVLKVNPDFLYQDYLSYNLQSKKDELFDSINRLPPDKLRLVSDMVCSLEKQN